MTGQYIGPSVTAFQAVPYSSKVEQWPGDERTEPAIKLKHGLHNWVILWLELPTADTIQNDKAKTAAKINSTPTDLIMHDILLNSTVNAREKTSS